MSTPNGTSETVTRPAEEAPVEPQTIGRFKILEKIGEGGCGVVYVAEQTEPVRRRVALKVIKLGMDTKAVVARFEAERQALAMMDHPNIAKVLDAGTTELGRPYFVMELVRGVPITQYCDQANLGTKERLDIFINVCQAIQHAHQKGIIHRDIKPSNILVALHDGVPVPKVIDFGIAKAIEGRLTDSTVYTQLNQFIGTPAYMSPEQAEMSGLDIDTRSDIYSLGVLLYELLTGKTPFDSEQLLQSGLDEMRRIIREKEPVRPSTRLTQELTRGGMRNEGAARRDPHPASPDDEEVRSSSRRLLQLKERAAGVKGDLDWIVMKCLEKDRARRYDTANGVSADIQRHLINQPVSARPPSVGYVFHKAFRRNRVLFTACTAVACALVAGLAVSSWQMIEARRARAGEQQQRLEAQHKQAEAEGERARADLQAGKALESERHARRLLYAADMNLAQQSLKLNNLGKAQRLLDRHRPQPGEEDLRGWEWRYLWQLTRSSALLILTNRPATRGWSVSFSPDGSRLAAGWLDGRVDLWDVPRGRLVRSLTAGLQSHEGQVAFSPVRNLLAATSEPKAVTLYDLDSGQESVLWRAPEEGGSRVRHIAFSPDGSRVLVYNRAFPGVEDEVWVVNLASGKVASHHPTVSARSLHGFLGACQLSPDNRRLYLTGHKSIRCIELATGKDLWETEPEVDAFGLTTLALSPDGRTLACCSGYEATVIRVRDAETGRLLLPLAGHTGWICRLVFSQDGRHLVSCATDQTIRFWDTENWTETKVLRGHTDEVHAVAISDTAKLVASAAKDGNLTLWQEDGKNALDGYYRLPADLGRDQMLPLSQGRALMLPSGEPPALFDLRDATSLAFPELGPSSNILGRFGSDVLCHWDGASRILVRQWNGNELILIGTVKLESGTRPTGLAYNPARQLVAWSESASATNILLASLAAPGRRFELQGNAPGLIPIRFSEDGKFMAAAGAARLSAWEVDQGQIVASVDGIVRDAAFACGGKVLIAAIHTEKNHRIEFHDLARQGQAPRHFHGNSPNSALAVSPSGALVAAIDNGQVCLFDPALGEPIGNPMHGHLNPVYGIAFSPDGERLISASGAREAVKLWDFGTRQELLTLGGTGSMLTLAKWSADGETIFIGLPWQAWHAPSWDEIAEAETRGR